MASLVLRCLRVDFPERLEVAGARRLAAFGRRAELLQMQIGDARFVERGGELALGEARPARGGDRAGVDQELDLGALELGEHRVGLGLLVADGEKLRLRHHFNRSISAIAAAGARTLPSWMT